MLRSVLSNDLENETVFFFFKPFDYIFPTVICHVHQRFFQKAKTPEKFNTQRSVYPGITKKRTRKKLHKISDINGSFQLKHLLSTFLFYSFKEFSMVYIKENRPCVLGSFLILFKSLGAYQSGNVAWWMDSVTKW